MASSVVVINMACVVVFGMMVLASVANAITCPQVVSTLMPCLGYVRGPGGPVPGPCCNGARILNNAAKTTPDRQQTCRCLKTLAANFQGINLGLAAAIPAKCGVNIPFKISLSTDCNKIK